MIYNMERLEAKRIFNVYFSKDVDIEIVIQKLKYAGATQGECIKTLVLELKMSLPEADEIVVFSKAWSESKDSLLRFRDSMYLSNEC